MSAAPARNWAAMLKEKKAAPAAKPVVSAPTTVVAAPAVAAPAEPTPAAAAPASPSVDEVAEDTVVSPVSSVSVATPVEVAPPAAAPAVTVLGPVTLPASLAALVQADEFRFAGAAAPRAPVVVPPHPVASKPATPPAPVAAAPAVTTSSELRAHPQWTAPQPVYNPPVNYFVPQQNVARPYGGELGSVPRYYNAERHFNAEQQQHAQPYHPSYQTPYHNYHGGAYGGAYGGASYNPYDNMYPSYYPGQGAPYMGGRLQAQQPYYPPRNYQQQQ